MIKYKKITLPILFFLIISFSANALELKLPKVGGAKGNLKGAKLNFTKMFFESSINYMEAQYHLFNALEMNDEASKTKKSIDFVKDRLGHDTRYALNCKKFIKAFGSISNHSITSWSKYA